MIDLQQPAMTHSRPNPVVHFATLAMLVASVLVLHARTLMAGSPVPDQGQLTYERDVRPIFKTHCFHCHGEGEELEGGLDLRLGRLTVKGGESGAAVVPGKTGESVLWQRVEAGEMPPEEVATRPTDEQIERIRLWIASGAKIAREEPDGLDPAEYITDEERSFWAFQPVGKPPLPRVAETERVRTPIDRFVLAKLQTMQLTFSPDADKRSLMRRAFFDLTGLPPTPDEAKAFLTDESPDAYEQLIDRLLDSPHYGERWARHWLDVAGYADSEGYTIDDAVRPDAYKFRDYVIRSFNADKPLDVFIREQLAGDEMVKPPYRKLLPKDIDRLIATGFLRMAVDGTGSAKIDHDVARNQVMADTIEIVTTSLLGLTVACAQCHNHRYDPIRQSDYYRMRAIFEPALDWKNWRTPQQRRISLYSDADRLEAQKIEQAAKKIDEDRTAKEKQYIDATFERELAKLDDSLHGSIRAARSTEASKRTAEQKKLLKEHPSVNVSAKSLYLYDRKAADDLKAIAARAAKVRSTKPKESFVRALTEPADRPPPKTYLFDRGDCQQPTDELPPGELTLLAQSGGKDIPLADPAIPTTGRRLAYARWLTSGQHPLTARVLVNRVWLHHFGRGIVATPGDFGFLGARPTHPELLDWLAGELVRQGWSLKKLHRTMMTSTVYRQASVRHAAGEAVDVENRFYWRMSVRRLEAEVIRDATLAISGQLNRKRFGPAVPVMADRVGQFVIGIENLNAGRPGAAVPMRGEQLRRSIYVQVRRSRPLAVLDTFDAPAMQPNCTARGSSTGASQSLMLMNGRFVRQQSAQLASRIRTEAGDDVTAQIGQLFRSIYARDPSEVEAAEAAEFLGKQADYFATLPKPKQSVKPSGQDAGVDPKTEALAGLCHALLSSNEFLYVD